MEAKKEMISAIAGGNRMFVFTPDTGKRIERKSIKSLKEETCILCSGYYHSLMRNI